MPDQNNRVIAQKTIQHNAYSSKDQLIRFETSRKLQLQESNKYLQKWPIQQQLET